MAVSQMTEKQLQQAIVAAAHLLGWLVYHTHDSRHSAKGFPDLVMVKGGMRGRLIFAELKTEKGKVSDEQAAWLRALEFGDARHLSGTNDIIEVYVWRPGDLDQALTILKG